MGLEAGGEGPPDVGKMYVASQGHRVDLGEGGRPGQ